MALMIRDELDLQQFDERNLKALCPFHEEQTPSFIWSKKSLGYHCYGQCGRNYDIIDVWMYKGATYLEAIQRLFELAGITYSFGEAGVKTKSQYRYPHEEPLNDKEQVYAYLEKRKISKATADYLDIREDEQGNCVFNYYDTNDVLTMVKYRPSRKVEKGESKNWCQKGADTAPMLFNMNRINVSQPLLICSGELDAAAAIEAGWTNAVSIPLGDQNVKWVEECFEWLEQFEQIIIAADNDSSGKKYCKSIVPQLGSWRCRVVQIPEQYKDLNEFLFRKDKHTVLDAIVHAPDTPVPSLIDFSDIQDMDTSDLDGFEMGLSEIDGAFDRFFLGTFNILSGIPSSGKSSLINLIVCQALNQDYDVWLFSRELPQWMSKNWLLHQLAGERNLVEKQNANGSVYYKIKPDCKKKIDDYYRGHLMVYKDEWANDLKSIQDSMIDAARKYGTKVFLIDNLMMVDLGANSDNLNQKQTEFVNWLIVFSMRYQVCVFLVAHPNKTQSTDKNIDMYAISGTSNIINLAHRAIGLRRVLKPERENGKSQFSKYNVVLSCIKDRLTGKTGEEWGIYYSVSSRRFYTNYEEYARQYAWDKAVYDTDIPMPETLLNEQEENEIFGEG